MAKYKKYNQKPKHRRRDRSRKVPTYFLKLCSKYLRKLYTGRWRASYKQKARMLKENVDLEEEFNDRKTFRRSAIYDSW